MARARTPDLDRKVQQELAALAHSINNNNCLASSNNNHSSNRSPTQSPPTTVGDKMDYDSATGVSKGKTKEESTVSECHKASSSEKLNHSAETNCSGGETDSPVKEPALDSRTRSLTEELSAKDREVSVESAEMILKRKKKTLLKTIAFA